MAEKRGCTHKAGLPKRSSPQGAKAGHDIVVIGASAGGVEAVTVLLKGLPHDLPAAVFVVYHIAADAPGGFDRLLDERSPLKVKYAQDGEPIRPGTVYLAVPDHHLLVPDGRVRLSRGPRENRTRPAIDPLFRSAAVVHGSRVIGVVLSGNLDDGAAGLAAVKLCGGVTVVQNPEEALFPDMPRNALAATEVDHVVMLADMAALLSRLVREPAPPSPPVPEALARENLFMNGETMKMPITDQMPGKLTMLVCPECGGSLWELKNGKTNRYRCHTGHAFTEKALLVEQGELIERALWSAVRILEERAKVYHKMAEEAEAGKRTKSAHSYRAKEQETMAEASAIRALVLGPPH